MRARRNRISRGPGSGFTLVEVLVSLAVVLIVLPMAMEAIALETAAASRSRRLLEAGTLAQSQLALLVATNQWQSGNLSGDFSPDFPDYTWTAQVTQYQATTPGATSPSTSASSTTLGGATSTLGNSTSTLGGATSTLGGSTSTLGGSSSGSKLGSSTTTTVTAGTLEELDLTVTWTANNTPYSITLSTLVYAGST